MVNILILGPTGIMYNSMAIDVDDGSLLDWVDAPVQLYDGHGETNVAQTDLAYVSFDYDDIWLYVRWDVFDNLSYSPQVLYDMGINLTGNLTGTDNDWDIYVSAETDRIGGIPVLVNISIRDRVDNHIWNASDDGNMIEDGSIYFDPTPGLPPDNLSVEARFPLAQLGIPTGVIFGQFRSHPSTSVESVVKDRVPDTGYIILTIDHNPPGLNNLNDTPDPQENGGNVNITVDITDDLEIVTVWVNITYPDNSWINLSMNNGTGNQWFFDIIYQDLGIYTYFVWANDTHNWNSTGPGTFTIQDTDGPFFNNLTDTPDPQENGGLVDIRLDVTDDIAVGTVWINITYPDSTWSNVSMNPGTGDEWYFTSNYTDLGVYTYTIWANDISDNWDSITETFTIQDTDGPFFDNLIDAPDPQENGGQVDISVDVRDDIALDTVWINISYPDGSWTNVSMNPGAGDQWYFASNFDDLGPHPYTIWASDTSDNWDSITGTFSIQDTDGPDFGDPLDTPDPQENGDFVDISVDIVDDIDIDGVWIEIIFPDDSSINQSMDKGSGDEWYISINFDDLGIYTYTIRANDTSNNWNASIPGTFTIVDTDGPTIDNLTHTPDPQENGDNVNITVDIIDDIGIDTVWVNITYPDGSWTNVTMDKGSGDEWYFNTSYPGLGSYTYTIWTNDTSNNWVSKTGTGAITIEDTDGPSFDNIKDTPDPQEKGKKVNISVDVTDDIGVDEVWINITFPDGTWINDTMKKGIDDQWFYNKKYSKTGEYTYTIWANDTSGNWNNTEPEDFSIDMPKALYMMLFFFYWPILLILFTVVLVRKYAFGNRFIRDIHMISSELTDFYATHPEYLLDDAKKAEDTIFISLKTGIPPEEYMNAILRSDSALQINETTQNDVYENLQIIKKFIKS
ncbi:MAG: hypothetical protein JSV09_11460 [Thermoplasmata archaeon]|nr:MAG: hypothetical protein JSV09_11460 [Thermoplasmata archaeon]